MDVQCNRVNCHEHGKRKKLNIPTHLSCCWCPSQAFPEENLSVALQLYKCPAGHKFYIEPEKETDGKNKFGSSSQLSE
jgi:hypothetical protein